jgi:hypothetical protein
MILHRTESNKTPSINLQNSLCSAATESTENYRISSEYD